MNDDLHAALSRLGAAELAFGIAIVNGDVDIVQTAAETLHNARVLRDNILLERCTALASSAILSLIKSPEVISQVIDELERRKA